MKTIKILAIIGVLFLTSFGSEVPAQEKAGYYYFAYASLDKYSEHIYITPVRYVSNEECGLLDGQRLTDPAVSNQFHDYMEAEYRGIIYKNEARVFNTASFSKAKAEEHRKEIMKYAEKITKIWDFEYLCE